MGGKGEDEVAAEIGFQADDWKCSSLKSTLYFLKLRLAFYSGHLGGGWRQVGPGQCSVNMAVHTCTCTNAGLSITMQNLPAESAQMQ